MAYYIMECEGTYPVAAIEKCYRDHIENDFWMLGERLDFNVPEPILYELEVDEYDEPPNLCNLDKSMPIPIMHNDLYEALVFSGVDNIQVYDAVIRDKQRNFEYKSFKSFNIVGAVSAADMKNSKIIGASDSILLDADFDRLVLDEKKCNGLLLFRLAENINALVVHERVKQEIEKRSIKGMFFYTNGEWAG